MVQKHRKGLTWRLVHSEHSVNVGYFQFYNYKGFRQEREPWELGVGGVGVFTKEEEKFNFCLEGWEDFTWQSWLLGWDWHLQASSWTEGSRHHVLRGTRCRSVLSWEMISTVNCCDVQHAGCSGWGLSGLGCSSVPSPPLLSSPNTHLLPGGCPVFSQWVQTLNSWTLK